MEVSHYKCEYIGQSLPAIRRLAFPTRQTLSHVLAFAPVLCDVLGRVEGEASVPRVALYVVRTYVVRYRHTPLFLRVVRTYVRYVTESRVGDERRLCEWAYVLCTI